MKIFLALFLSWFLFFSTLSATPSSPHFPPDHPFPVLQQSRNSCFFSSIAIASEARYGARLRVSKILSAINFDGSHGAYAEDKIAFSRLTGIQIREYRTKDDLLSLLSRWVPVLVSTEVPLKWSTQKVRHVSVAYSWDEKWVWVSDPLDHRRKRLSWETLFLDSWKTRYYNLRTVSVDPYTNWSQNRKEAEKKGDYWNGEEKIGTK